MIEMEPKQTPNIATAGAVAMWSFSAAVKKN